MLKQHIMQLKREFWEHKTIILNFPRGVALFVITALLVGLTYATINIDEESGNGFSFSFTTSQQQKIVNNTRWQFDSSVEADKKMMRAVDTQFITKQGSTSLPNANQDETSDQEKASNQSQTDTESKGNSLGDMSLRVANLTIRDGFKLGIPVFFFLLAVLILPGMINRDKQDNSIYFWRSLPVSETRNLLTKLLVAAVILPTVYFSIFVLTATLGIALVGTFQWLFSPENMQVFQPLDVLLSTYSAVFIGFLSTGLLMILALPVLGWAMLCSTFYGINRYIIPLMLLPILAIIGVEDLIFNASYLGDVFYIYLMSVLKATSIFQKHLVLPPDIYQLIPAVLIGLVLIAASIYVKRWKVD